MVRLSCGIVITITITIIAVVQLSAWGQRPWPQPIPITPTTSHHTMLNRTIPYHPISTRGPGLPANLCPGLCCNPGQLTVESLPYRDTALARVRPFDSRLCNSSKSTQSCKNNKQKLPAAWSNKLVAIAPASGGYCMGRVPKSLKPGTYLGC